jgi:hypothetical protein
MGSLPNRLKETHGTSFLTLVFTFEQDQPIIMRTILRTLRVNLGQCALASLPLQRTSKLWNLRVVLSMDLNRCLSYRQKHRHGRQPDETVLTEFKNDKPILHDTHLQEQARMGLGDTASHRTPVLCTFYPRRFLTLCYDLMAGLPTHACIERQSATFHESRTSIMQKHH